MLGDWESGLGYLDLGLGLRIGDLDSGLGLGIWIGYWVVGEIGDWDWDWGLGLGIGIRNWDNPSYN